MSHHWPDPQDSWGTPAKPQDWQQSSHNMGGYQAPPGYQSGGWPTQWQASPAYGPPGPGYAYPHPSPTGPGPTTGNVVSALVVGAITMMTCYGTNLISVVLACIALGKREENPDEAAKLTRYAWVSNWIHLTLLGLIIAAVVTLVIVAESTHP